MGKKSGGEQEITQRTEIPGFLKPFVKEQASIGSGALRRLNSQLSGAGADELVAGLDPLQEEAFDLAAARARGAGGFIPTAQEEILATAQGVDPASYIDPAAYDALSSTAAGDFLYGGQGFEAALEAATRAANRNVLSTFGRAGRTDSGLARTAIGRNASDAFALQYGNERARQLSAAGVLSQLGGSERGRQLAAAQSLPQLSQVEAGILQNLGNIRQGQAQRELTAPISAQESLLAAAGGGIPLTSLLGSTSTQSGGGGSNLATNVLGGSALGLGLGSLTAAEGATGLAALGGPWGLAAGGGLGILGGLLS